MRDAIRYYDLWVNGADLPLADLVAGKAPKQAPALQSVEPAGAPPDTLLHLSRYEGRNPELPELDPDAAAPIPHVLLHGSMATGDACGFSDVDIAVIVDDVHAHSVQQHRRAIYGLRKLLRAIFGFDALMHHGLMFFPLSGLDRYDERFLPVETLRRARVLHGPTTLRVRAIGGPMEDFRASLLAAAASLRKRFREMDFIADDYQLKSVLSGILLMPSRVLAARGVHVYKRDSFDLARDFFTPAQWDLIGRAEALRSTWVRPPAPALSRFLPASTHPHLRRIAGSHLSPKVNARRLSSRMIDSLRSSASAFLDRVEAIG